MRGGHFVQQHVYDIHNMYVHILTDLNSGDRFIIHEQIPLRQFSSPNHANSLNSSKKNRYVQLVAISFQWNIVRPQRIELQTLM